MVVNKEDSDTWETSSREQLEVSIQLSHVRDPRRNDNHFKGHKCEETRCLIKSLLSGKVRTYLPGLPLLSVFSITRIADCTEEANKKSGRLVSSTRGRESY